MVSIVTKNIKGNEYLYLVTSIREGKKIKQKTIKYIGKKRFISKEEFECMKNSVKKIDWILNEKIDYLSYQDHNEMMALSKNYKLYLKSLDKVSREKEKEKFLSIFISNSNAIEGSTLSIKDTFNYLFNDILPSGKSKKELYMADNLLNAWNYMEKNTQKLPTLKDLKKLHLLINKGIESEKTLGKFKPVQNYIGDVLTSSYLFVEERMKQLMKWIKQSFKHVNDFELAFQSHSQFETIHPFVDGNGRVGRLLINWLLLHKSLMPLAIPLNKRNEYINALENSRKGKIEAIVKFCYKIYKKQYKSVV